MVKSAVQTSCVRYSGLVPPNRFPALLPGAVSELSAPAELLLGPPKAGQSATNVWTSPWSPCHGAPVLPSLLGSCQWGESDIARHWEVF